jgi:hypothetical protein
MKVPSESEPVASPVAAEATALGTILPRKIDAFERRARRV